MKKTLVMLAAALACCGLQARAQSSLGDILSTVKKAVTPAASDTAKKQSGALGDILGGILGGTASATADITGSWKYSSPKCTLTGNDLLAQAGGAIVTNKLESEIAPYFKKIGITSGNTSFTFNKDSTFAARIDGKKLEGTYAYAPKTGSLQLKSGLMSINGYARRSGKKLDLLFDSTKLLTLVQKVGSLTANETLNTVAKLAGSYKGSKIGFELSKQ